MIVYVERGQRRIPVQYAKRVVGRRMMGGQSTYLPIKVNTAGVVPIIFASAVLYLPAQLAVFFPTVGWVQAVASALSTGWLNWVLSVLLIVAFAYFYSSMVFNPTETADQLRKQGGFIPGAVRVRHGGLHQGLHRSRDAARRPVHVNPGRRSYHHLLVHGQLLDPGVRRNVRPHHGRRCNGHASPP